MKNKMLWIAFIGFLFSTQAQDKATKVSFALRAGMNFQTFNGKNADGSSIKNNIRTGYHIGAQVEVPLAPDFYLQPGLLFSTKGSNWSSTKVGLYYIELPINLVYKPLLGSGHLILGLGPYLAYGIGGKVRYTDESHNVNYASDASTINASYTFKPFDAGANVFVGYEFSNKIFVQVNTQLGMVRINPTYSFDPQDKTSVKNTGFGVSIGYRF